MARITLSTWICILICIIVIVELHGAKASDKNNIEVLWTIPDVKNITIYENESIIFYVYCRDAEENNLRFCWYINSLKINHTSNDLRFSIGYGTAGTYKITCVISDDLENVTVSWNVVVQPRNRIPEILCYAPENVNIYINEGGEMNFTVIVRDLDMQTLTYEIYLDNELLFIDYCNWYANITYTFKPNYTQAGIKNFKIVINDSFDRIEHCWILNVIDVNLPPEIIYVSVVKDEILENAVVELSINAIDPDNDFVIYYWYVNGVLMIDYHEKYYVWQTDYTSAGSHKIKVVVSDGTLTNSYEWFVNVTNVNRIPEILFYEPEEDCSILETKMINFYLTVYEPDNEFLYYKWYINDIFITYNQTLEFTTNYASAGNYTVKVIISDSIANITKIWNLSVENNNRQPIAKITVPKYMITVGETLVFDASQSFDLDNDTLTYVWNINNIEYQGITFSHTFISPNKYIITLEVSDIYGSSGTNFIEIIVEEKIQPKKFIPGFCIIVCSIAIFCSLMLMKIKNRRKIHIWQMIRNKFFNELL